MEFSNWKHAFVCSIIKIKIGNYMMDGMFVKYPSGFCDYPINYILSTKNIDTYYSKAASYFGSSGVQCCSIGWSAKTGNVKCLSYGYKYEFGGKYLNGLLPFIGNSVRVYYSIMFDKNGIPECEKYFIKCDNGTYLPYKIKLSFFSSLEDNDDEKKDKKKRIIILQDFKYQDTLLYFR